jgi:anti-anti-sigma factor
MTDALLVIEADRTELQAEIHCCGEIDASSVAGLQRALGLAVLSGVPAVRVDLRSVTFIDSSGLHCLLGAAEACEEMGKTFELDPGATTSRLLELCGMADRFNVRLVHEPPRLPAARTAR